MGIAFLTSPILVTLNPRMERDDDDDDDDDDDNDDGDDEGDDLDHNSHDHNDHDDDDDDDVMTTPPSLRRCIPRTTPHRSPSRPEPHHTTPQGDGGRGDPILL